MTKIINLDSGIIVDTNRGPVIARIRAALLRRSGKAWSVTGGSGSVGGGITIDAPPARRTAHWVQRAGTVGNPGDYDLLDTGVKGGHLTPADAAELAALLGLAANHFQGQSIAASHEHYIEYIDRAEGRPPRAIAQPYWD